MTQKTGRPPRLTQSDEFELYRLRLSGVAIKTCAGFFRVSVPTANRVIARVKARLGKRAEPLAREFRDRLNELRDST